MSDKLTPLFHDTDLAEALGISVDKVRRRSRAGEFPVVRIGRDYRYTEADYEAIVAAHRREAKVTPANPFGIRRRGKAS